MNDTPSETGAPRDLTREEFLSALFANMVVQQTNMAMMLLGKVAHPETGQIIQDLETAKMFIDQLEMLQAKTKGNLTKQEEGLIKQALSALHMAFVETVDAPSGEPQIEHPGPKDTAPAAADAAPTPASPAPAPPADAPASASAAQDESRKRFSKKY